MLKNIESKNEQQLEAIRDQGHRKLNLINKSILRSRPEKREIESVLLINEVNEIVEGFEDKDFSIIHSNRKVHDFKKITYLNRFGSKLFSSKISIADAIKEQVKMEQLFKSLKGYNTSNTKKKKSEKMKLRRMKKEFLV